MHRDGWNIHCVGEDAKTPISPMLHVAEESTLLRLLRASGATDEELEKIERDMKQTFPDRLAVKRPTVI
jgi:hypothetical protein